MITRSGREIRKEKEKVQKRAERKQKQLKKTCEFGAELRRLDEERRLTIQNESLLVPFPPDESFDGVIPDDRKVRKMSEFLNRIDKLKLDGNIAENWKKFKRNFEIFMTAGDLNAKTDEIKIGCFLNAVGEDAVDVFDTFGLSEEDSKVYATVVGAFENFCKPKKNTVYDRFLFYQRKQKEGEPFDTFLMDIRRLVKNCEFDDKENEMMRDRIVMGIYDKKIQVRMLETSDLTYAQAVEKGRQGETTREQAETMNKAAEIHEIRSNDTRNRNATSHVDTRSSNSNNNNKDKYNRNSNASSSNNKGKKSYTQHRQNDSRNQNKSNNENRSDRNNCKYCNYSHKFGTKYCPAYGKTCKSCSRDNHFSSVCRLKNVSTLSPFSDSDYDFDDNNEFFIGTLSKETRETDDAYSYPWIERIGIDESNVPFKVDTGAGVDVLPLSVLKKIAPRSEIQRTAITLRAFAGEKIKPIGTCSLICSFHDVTLKIKFAVVDFDCTPILGLKSCIRFKIVQPSRTRIFRNSNQRRNL